MKLIILMLKDIIKKLNRIEKELKYLKHNNSDNHTFPDERNEGWMDECFPNREDDSDSHNKSWMDECLDFRYNKED